MSNNQWYIIAICFLNKDAQFTSEYFICDQNNLGKDLTFLINRYEGGATSLSNIKILKPNEALAEIINKKYEYNDEIKFNLIKYIKSKDIINNSNILLFTSGCLGFNSKIYNENNFMQAVSQAVISYQDIINNLRHKIFANVEKYTNAYINGDVVTMSGEHISSEYAHAIKNADATVQNFLKHDNSKGNLYDIILNTYIKAMEETDSILRRNIENNKNEYINVLNEYIDIKDRFISYVKAINKNINITGQTNTLDNFDSWSFNNKTMGNLNISSNEMEVSNKLQKEKKRKTNQHYIGLLYSYNDKEPNDININYFISNSKSFADNVSFWLKRYQSDAENLFCIKILKPNSNLNKVIEIKLLEVKGVKEFNLLQHIKPKAIEQHSSLLLISGGILGINEAILNLKQLESELIKCDNEYLTSNVEEEHLSSDISHYMNEILGNYEQQGNSLDVPSDKRKMSGSHTSDYLDINSKTASKLSEENNDDDESEGDAGTEGFRPS